MTIERAGMKVVGVFGVNFLVGSKKNIYYWMDV
jgi:hypothetical protein